MFVSLNHIGQHLFNPFTSIFISLSPPSLLAIIRYAILIGMIERNLVNVKDNMHIICEVVSFYLLFIFFFSKSEISLNPMKTMPQQNKRKLVSFSLMTVTCKKKGDRFISCVELYVGISSL